MGDERRGAEKKGGERRGEDAGMSGEERRGNSLVFRACFHLDLPGP